MQTKTSVLALYFFLLTALLLPVTAFSQEIVPFDSGNQSPLVSIYGLPGPGNYLLLPTGSTQAGINTAIASNFAVDQNANENIILDGETTRFTLNVRHAFAHGLELGLKVPYIIQGGGFLDDFIKDYHRTFGMPQGGRDEAPSNRLLYRYRRNGTKRLLLDSSGSGIGDVQITAALQLYKDRKTSRGLSVNIDLKLPTGDSDALRGSGGTDLSAWLTGGTGLGEFAGK
ncbi:MAG: DUF3187 family protein, partial [Deltaproteobacteria bacterium]|nr:DUF3187 family protein [Deltaproteobacteria bacterium]